MLLRLDRRVMKPDWLMGSEYTVWKVVVAAKDPLFRSDVQVRGPFTVRFWKLPVVPVHIPVR